MKGSTSKRPRRERVKRGVHILPNVLTAGSLFCGFYAIVATLNGRVAYAAAAILAAVLFDGLDGKVARLTKTTSRFGEEFDSLSDLVAFGVAPALLMFSWTLRPYGRLGWLAAFLYVACGALRLARFNVQIHSLESRYFRGLPIPGAAAFLAASVLFFRHLRIFESTHHFVFLPVMFCLAFLMVSSIRYHSFKNLETLRRRPFSTLVAVFLAIVVVVAQPEIVLFVFTTAYVMLGPVQLLVSRYRKAHGAEEPERNESLAR